MNKAIEKLKEEYVPRIAIVVYQTKGYSEYYLESHEIDAAGKFLEGRPLKAETISGMVEVFSEKSKKESQIGGDIPANLLSYVPEDGKYSLSWYRPAEKRTLWFKEDLHIPSGKAMVPPMAYIVEGNQLTVWALGSDARPDDKTKLFHAPFHNVGGGSVCLGSAKAKKPTNATFTEIIRYWEEMFWNSEFSHINGQNPVKGNLNLVWKEQVENPNRPFPINVLIEVKQKSKK